jgi:hypothetical protein
MIEAERSARLGVTGPPVKVRAVTDHFASPMIAARGPIASQRIAARGRTASPLRVAAIGRTASPVRVAIGRTASLMIAVRGRTGNPADLATGSHFESRPNVAKALNAQGASAAKFDAAVLANPGTDSERIPAIAAIPATGALRLPVQIATVGNVVMQTVHRTLDAQVAVG